MPCENRRISILDVDGVIRIGVWDTLNVRSQQFDISAWEELYPNGQLIIIHQRKGDEIPYAVADVSIENGIATWTFDETDSAVPGYGVAALAYLVGTTYKARTVGFTTYTAPTVGMTGTTPPDPWESWFERVLEAAAAAQQAEENASASETAAAASAAAAQEAQQGSESAQDAAEAAQTAAEDAQIAAESAQAAADASKNAAGISAAAAAESAADAAASAAGAAQSAATAAASAAGAAQSATDAAASAAEAAQSAAGAVKFTEDQTGTITAAQAQQARANILAASAVLLDAVLNAFPTATVGPAPIASFADGADGLPVKDLAVTMEPIQSGSGDPSPDNVRPITGRSSVTVTRAGATETDDPVSVTVQLGQTVYGGTLDVATGELTIDRQMLTYTGAENWLFFDAGTANARTVLMLGADAIFISDNSTGGIVSLCDKLPVAIITAASTDTGIRTYYSTSAEFSGGQQLVVVRPANAASLADADAFKAWLSSIGGINFCAKLRNPTTVQLSPQEMTTLLGNNTIWSDSGDVTVTYRQDIATVIGS